MGPEGLILQKTSPGAYIHAATSVDGSWREAFVSRRSCSSDRSAFSASNVNSIRTTYRLSASSKAEALNDDGDNVDDGITIYAIGAPTHGQDDMQVIEE